jgi:hypothetical protein
LTISPEILERFIARVEENAHAEAIEEFYAENASMRENLKEPRVGRDQLVERERATLARARSVRSRCVRPVFVDGDRVVVRWIFEFEWLDGTNTRMEELAYQRWENDRVVEEQFFYDPAQLVHKVPYRCTFVDGPGYLHARVEGDRTPQNVKRYFDDVVAASVERGMTDVLLEMNLTGPSLGKAGIFSVIQQSSRDASRFKRIAYVEVSSNDPAAPKFAETVAANRGANVRLFPDVALAARWLTQAQ